MKVLPQGILRRGQANNRNNKICSYRPEKKSLVAKAIFILLFSLGSCLKSRGRAYITFKKNLISLDVIKSKNDTNIFMMRFLQ